MGLFRKSPPTADPTEVEGLRAQLAALQRRLETAEVDQTHLGSRVVALDDITADLAGRHANGRASSGPIDTNGEATVEARLAALTGRFDSVAALGDQLGRLGQVLADIEQRTVELREHADERHAALLAQVDELRSTPPTEPDTRFTALDERLAATDAETARRLAALDERLTNVSTELANQIGELGGDIDAIAGLASTTDRSDDGGERIEALVTGQTKLASEQARYEIAFREDLALLAEQIRRTSGR